MNDTQDPNRQVGYLQQCLSSDKKPLGFFLGAGCPMAIRIEENRPLIPDIAGMTDFVCEQLKKQEPYKKFYGTLEKQFETDDRQNPNVEDMLTHIRALRAVAGKDTARGLSTQDLEKLDEKICHIIYELVNRELPNPNTPYHQLASWVDAVRRENPIEVFTTNYDLLIEQAFEDCRVPYFDGFAGVRKPFFDLRAMEEDMLPPRWARLWKLHGSVNWYQIEKYGVFRGGTNEASLKRVIHPSHLKYEESRRMPYLAMLDRLRAFLKQPTATLILCGYSFRDEHLNEVIVQGLQYTQTAIAFGLLFDKIIKYSQATALASKRSNLNLLAPDGAVIGGRNSKWTELDKELISDNNGKWVKWTQIDPTNENSKHKALFTLGEFTVLGQFLQELAGNFRPSSEVEDV